MTEFLKKLLGLQDKKPVSVTVYYLNPEDIKQELCQHYSYSVWSRIEQTYRRVITVTSVEEFYN